jgi:hypothetical protein
VKNIALQNGTGTCDIKMQAKFFTKPVGLELYRMNAVAYGSHLTLFYFFLIFKKFKTKNYGKI